MDDDDEAGNDGQRSSRAKRGRADRRDPRDPPDPTGGPPWRYAQILERAHHWAFKFTGDSDVADDLAAPVAEAVDGQLNGTRKHYPEVPVKTWDEFSRYVSTAVVNRLRDTAASESARSTRQSEYATRMTPDMLDSQTPDLVLERLEQRRALDEAIGNLKPPVRDYVICVNESGMSYSATAEKYGVKRATVERAIVRAYVRLRPQLIAHRLSDGSGPVGDSGSTGEGA